jgi:hypothetical protein
MILLLPHPLSYQQVVSLSQFSSVSQVERLLTGGLGDGKGPNHSILSGYFDPIFSHYQRIFQNILFYIVRFAPASIRVYGTVVPKGVV